MTSNNNNQQNKHSTDVVKEGHSTDTEHHEETHEYVPEPVGETHQNQTALEIITQNTRQDFVADL